MKLLGILAGILFTIMLVPQAHAAIDVGSIKETTVASLTFNITALDPDTSYELVYNNTTGGLSVARAFESDVFGEGTNLITTFNSTDAALDEDGLYNIHVRNVDTSTIEQSKGIQYGFFYSFVDTFSDGSLATDHWVVSGNFDTVAETSGVLRISNGGASINRDADIDLRQNNFTNSNGVSKYDVFSLTVNTVDIDGYNVFLRNDQGFSQELYDSGNIDGTSTSADIRVEYESTAGLIRVYENDTLFDTITFTTDNDLYFTVETFSQAIDTNERIEVDNVAAYFKSSNIVGDGESGLIYQQKAASDQRVIWTDDNFNSTGTASFATSDDGTTFSGFDTYDAAAASKFIKIDVDMANGENQSYWKGDYLASEDILILGGTDTIPFVFVLDDQPGTPIQTQSDPAGDRTVRLRINGSNDVTDMPIDVLDDKVSPVLTNIISQFHGTGTATTFIEDESYQITYTLLQGSTVVFTDSFTSVIRDDIDDTAMKIHAPLAGGILDSDDDRTLLVGVDADTDVRLEILINDVKVQEFSREVGTFQGDPFSTNIIHDFTGIAQGKNELTVNLYKDDIIFDNLLDSQSIEFFVYNDIDPLRILKPSDGSTIDDTNIVKLTVDYLAFDQSTISFTVRDSDGNTVDSITKDAVVSNERQTLSAFTVPLDDGDYTWSATLTTGGQSRTYSTPSSDFTVDYEDISITALSPDDIITEDTTPQYSVRLTNTIGGKLDVLVDGSIVSSTTVDPSIQGKTHVFNPATELSVGNHTWNATFTAGSGTTATSNTLNFEVVAPGTAGASIILTSPADKASFDDSSVDFSFTVNATSNTGTARLVVDGDTKNDYQIVTTGEHDFNATVEGLTSGVHGWYVEYDMNTSQTLLSDTRSFNIETNVSISLLAPEDDEIIPEPPVSLEALVSANIRGSVFLILDGETVDNVLIDSGDNNRVQFTIDTIEAGEHVWRMVWLERGRADVDNGISSETRTFDLVKGGGAVDSPDGIQKTGLNTLIADSLGSSFGVNRSTALAMFAIMVSLIVAVGVGIALRNTMNGATLGMAAGGITLVGFALAGYFPSWLIIVLIVIAAGITASVVRKAGGG